MELTALLCSANEHKARELQAALPGWRVELLGAGPLPDETGETYEDNARAKARFGRSAGPAGAWMIGEDSGIEVEALGGGPGIASARWAEDPVGALLRELGDVEERRARYVCALVALPPECGEIAVRGVLEGTIARGPGGAEGFGYDPIFVPAGESRTVAELGNRWKQTHSHRARAAQAFLECIEARGITPLGEGARGGESKPRAKAAAKLPALARGDDVTPPAGGVNRT